MNNVPSVPGPTSPSWGWGSSGAAAQLPAARDSTTYYWAAHCFQFPNLEWVRLELVTGLWCFAVKALQKEREALNPLSYETLRTPAGSLAELVLGDAQEKTKNPTHVTRGAAVFMLFEYKNVFCEREEIDTTKWLFIHPWNVPREWKLPKKEENPGRALPTPGSSSSGWVWNRECWSCWASAVGGLWRAKMGIVTLLFFTYVFLFDRKRKDKWQEPVQGGFLQLVPSQHCSCSHLSQEGQGWGDTKLLPGCCSLLSLKFWYFKETTPHFSNHHLWIPVELTKYFDFLPAWVSFWGNRTTQDGFQKEQSSNIRGFT